MTDHDVSASSLDICLFGNLKVTADGLPIEFRTRTVGWLFAYLVINHNKTVNRDDLMAALWPNAQDLETTRNTLRRQLAFVRKALGIESGRLRAPSKSTLWMDLTGVSVDLFTFEAAIESDNLAGAVDVYKGEFLSGCGGPWTILKREECRTRYVSALKSLGTLSLNSRDPERAIRYLKPCFHEDRSQEKVALDLMEAYTIADSLAEAIQVYRELRAELMSVYAVLPDEITTDKYRHLVKTLANRRRLNPSPRSLAKAPIGYVPIMLVRLIGRRRDVAEVLSRLDRNSLVTLTGAGGIGKSMLALEVAHQAWPDFLDGVWFVDLLNVRSPEHLAPEIAAALELQCEDVANEKSLLGSLRPRSLLLLLDNCEHLIPGITKLCRHIIQACPGVRLLATSRQPLRLRGEQNWIVPTLALPPLPPSPIYECTGPEALSDALLQYEAVELFVERAEQSSRHFSLTQDNARAVARICNRLDGLPLAIDLAAAWVASLSLEQIESRLEDRFAALTEGDPSGPTHHQTLRLTVDWSYEALRPDQQLVWKAISVFSGEWTEDAAVAILQDFELMPPVTVQLNELVDHSVVVRTAYANTHRFHMLETLRDYGRIRLQELPKDLPLFRDRHLEYMLSFVSQPVPAIASDQPDNLKLLNSSMADFRAALEWAAQSGDGESGLKLATGLWRFWNQRGEYEEGYSWLDSMLKLASSNVDPQARMKAMSAAGNLAYRQGDNKNAKRWFQMYKALACMSNNRRAMASAHGNLGNVATQENRLEDARGDFERSVALFEELGDARGIALSKSNMAILACRRNDFATAHQYHMESITLFREQADRLNLAVALANLAETRLSAGEDSVAASTLEESLTISLDIGYMRTAAHCLCIYLTIAIRRSLLRDAAVLIGISEVWKERDIFVISQESRTRFDADLTLVQDRLGQEAMEETIGFGRKLTEDQRVEYMIRLGGILITTQ